jgi:nucleoside-diphosphate-sugar epimerase
MRVAVTGGSGFVGRHVLRELRRRGVEVVAITRTRSRLAEFVADIEIIEMDLSIHRGDLFHRAGAPDALIHLAWEGLPNYQSSTHVDVQLPSQIEFLLAWIRSGLPKLTVAGTCYEYGLRSGELNEAEEPLPCTEYGKAKNQLRLALEQEQSRSAFELTWLRLFYLYGDGQSKQSLFGSLDSAIAAGSESFEMSGGEQERDYLPVEKAARLLVDLSVLPGNHGVVNICSGQPVKVGDLVNEWIALRGSAIVPQRGRIPYSQVEPMSFWGNATKLKSLLGNL